MSDQQNMFDNLRSDEEASIESDEIGSSTADFFVDDEVPVRVVPGPRSDDVLATVDQEVPIFNTSDLQGEEENVRQRERRGNDQRLPLNSATMDMGELNPSISTVVASTITGGTGRRQQPAGGEITRVERQADLLSAEEMSKTVEIRRQTRNPLLPDRRQEHGEPARGLKPSTPAQRQPQQSARPTVKGGAVDVNELVWQTDDENSNDVPAEYQEEINDPWIVERNRLDEEEVKLEQELMDVLLRIKKHSSEKGAHLIQGEEEVAAARESVISGVQYGQRMELILQDRVEREQTAIGPLDLVSRMAEQWSEQWETAEEAQKISFSMDKIRKLMAQATWLIEEQGDKIEQVIGREELEDLSQRHRLIAIGLNDPRGIPKSLGRWFPKNDAEAILHWYQRLVLGFAEMIHVQGIYQMSAYTLKTFVKAYPGPKMDREEEKQDEWRRELSRKIGQAPPQHPSIRSVGSREKDALFNSVDGSKALYREKEKAMAEAATSGYGFRMGSNQEACDPAREMKASQKAQSSQQVNHYNPANYTQNYGYGGTEKKRVTPEHLWPANQGSVNQSETDDSDTKSEAVSGYTEFGLEEIREMLEAVTEKRLSEEGCMSTLALKIVMDNFPRFGLYPKDGRDAYVSNNFNKIAKDIKPHTKGSFISVPQWWKKLNDWADDQGWSIPNRIRFIARTGGLAPGHNENVRLRTINLMETINIWATEPDYRKDRDVHDNEYWFHMWIQLSVKIVAEFHTVLHEEDIRQGMEEMMDAKKYKFTSTTDPLNEDFYKVYMLYQDLIIWLTERSSDMVNSPLYIYTTLKEWLVEQGEMGAGKTMINYIDKALAKLSTEPELVFPRHHGLTRNQLADVKRKGQGQATSNTYRLILDQLKRRAVTKDLEYNLYSLAQIGALIAGGGVAKAVAEGKGGKSKKAVLSVTTDVSSMTLNTTASQQEGERTTPKYPACTDCGMFHNAVECPFWDKTRKLFKVKNFLGYRTATQINADGSSEPNKYWTDKLEKFGFRAMGITNPKDQQKILADLKKVASELPEASIEERRKYAEKQRNRPHQVNLATVPESSVSTDVAGPSKIEAKMLELANQVQKVEGQLKKARSKSRKTKTKRSKRTKVSDSDSSSAPDLMTSSDDSDGFEY